MLESKAVALRLLWPWMTESLRRHATRDFVIWYCGSNADLILHVVDEQNVERCINSSGWRSGCENEMVACILQNEVKVSNNWGDFHLIVFVPARNILNQWKCFSNYIITLQEHDSALTGYSWCLFEFQWATSQLYLTVIWDSQLKYASWVKAETS